MWTLAMGYLIATGEIFENMLQLKGFGLYFEGVMNRKWLLSYKNNDIRYTDRMLGGSGTCSSRKFWNDWCNLVSFDVLFWSD